MSAAPDVLIAIVLMGVATFACRLGGFTLMRFVTVTPMVEAWLKAIPVALIGAILGPIAVNGGAPEWLGLAAAAATMRLVGNDLAACVVAIGVVAAARSVGA